MHTQVIEGQHLVRIGYATAIVLVVAVITGRQAERNKQCGKGYRDALVHLNFRIHLQVNYC